MLRIIMKRSRIYECTPAKSCPVEESEVTMNLRRCRAPMNLLRPTSTGKKKRGGKLERKIRSEDFRWRVNKGNSRLLRRGESEGLRFAESPAKSGLGRRKSAQGRPSRALHHAQTARQLKKIIVCERSAVLSDEDI